MLLKSRSQARLARREILCVGTGIRFSRFRSGLTCYPCRPKQSAQDVQGEAQGDPIILEGGDSANVDGLPHSGMLEQVRILISSLHLVT